jgi:endonuclease YncB( thermonuclease family)
MTKDLPLDRYMMQKKKTIRMSVIFIIAAIVIFRLFGCPNSRSGFQSSDDFSRYNDQTFTCVKVVDGDTIDVNISDLKANRSKASTRIRLWGIDTPEIAHFDRPTMYYGYQSAEFARKLMAGKQVKLELLQHETRDKFGRLLAYIWLTDGRLYNELALKEGFAYAETRFPHPRLNEFIELEKQARGERKGLWLELTPDQLPRWYPKTKLKTFWQQQKNTSRSSSEK